MNSISNQKSYQKFRYSIKNFLSNFHFHDRTRVIYFFREFFRIVSILLTIRSFCFIDSFNIQLENFEMIVISNKKIHIFTLSQYRDYLFFSRTLSKHICFFINRLYFLISTIISISISKIVRIIINIWYCNDFFHSRVFRFSIYLFKKINICFLFRCWFQYQIFEILHQKSLHQKHQKSFKTFFFSIR